MRSGIERSRAAPWPLIVTALYFARWYGFLFGLQTLRSLTWATGLGGADVLLRSASPLLLGKRVTNVQSKRVALVRFRCYAIVLTLLAGGASAAFGAGSQ